MLEKGGIFGPKRGLVAGKSGKVPLPGRKKGHPDRQNLEA
jgi:hypothetical protein